MNFIQRYLCLNIDRAISAKRKRFPSREFLNNIQIVRILYKYCQMVDFEIKERVRLKRVQYPKHSLDLVTEIILAVGKIIMGHCNIFQKLFS